MPWRSHWGRVAPAHQMGSLQGSLQRSQSGCRFVAQPKVISTVERLNLENMTGQDVGERLFGCLKLGRMLMIMFFFDSCGVVGDGSKPSVASSRGSHWPAILVTRVAVLANTRHRKQIKHLQFVLLPATGWNDSKSLQKIRRLLSQRGIEYAIAKIRWIPSWDSGTTWGRTKAMWDKPEKSWKQISYAAALVCPKLLPDLWGTGRWAKETPAIETKAQSSKGSPAAGIELLGKAPMTSHGASQCSACVAALKSLRRALKSGIFGSFLVGECFYLSYTMMTLPTCSQTQSLEDQVQTLNPFRPSWANSLEEVKHEMPPSQTDQQHE